MDESVLPFFIPRKLEELEQDQDGRVRVNVEACNSLTADDVTAACKASLRRLRECPLQIAEQDTLEDVYVTVRGLESLDSALSWELTKILSQKHGELVTCGLRELQAEGRPKSDPVVVKHRNTLQELAYFLHCIYKHHCTEEAQNARNGSTKATKKKAGGRSKGASIREDEGGYGLAWEDMQERIVKAMRLTLQANLDEVLFHAASEKARLVEVCARTALMCLEDSRVTKEEGTLRAAKETLCLAATRHGGMDIVAEGLFRLAQAHDHGPDLAADVALHAEGSCKTASLGVALLKQFLELDPSDYDAAVEKDTKPVKHAGELLQAIAARQPGVVVKSLSQVVQYFGCQSATAIRLHLVSALGDMMRHFRANRVQGAGSAEKGCQGTVADMLLFRANDANAHVRRAALTTVDALVQERVWPLALVPLTASRALTRLQDTTLGAAAALGLLCTLTHSMCSCISKDSLDDSELMAIHKGFEERLQNMVPDIPEDTQDGKGEEDNDPDWAVSVLGQPLVPGQEQAGAAGPGGSEPTSIILPTQLDDTAGPAEQTQGGNKDGLTYSELRLLLATFDVARKLSQTLAMALPEVVQLLGSGSADVAERAIQLMTLCRQRGIRGADDQWRRVWDLIDSPVEKVRDTVLDAFFNALVGRSEDKGVKASGAASKAMAIEVVAMYDGTSLRDKQTLEELLKELTRGSAFDAAGGKSSSYGADVATFMAKELHRAVGKCVLLLQEGGEELEQTRHIAGKLSGVCALMARHAPNLFVASTEHLVADLKSSHVLLKDALLVRDLASTLGDLAPTLHTTQRGSSSTGYQPSAYLPLILTKLTSVLLSSHLPDSAWFSAAQAAVGAIYKLHDKPFQLMEPLLRHLAKEASGSGGQCSAVQLARAMFTVGCVATNQLVLVDKLVKRVRAAAAAADASRSAGKAAAAQQNDIDKEMGVGQARDHQLDALQEALEAEMAEAGGLLACWGALVSAVCHNRALLESHPLLTAAAMQALAKLMAVDMAYCEASCPVFFTRLSGKGFAVQLPPAVKCDMLVSLADLVRRFPNVMEPWTEHMFTSLEDPEPDVSRTCLRVLAHLVLSSMTKPRGHVAAVARCLAHADATMREMSVQFFNSLNAMQADGGKATGVAKAPAGGEGGGAGGRGGSSTVVKYLPEIISLLVRGANTPSAEEFTLIMERLLCYVRANKQGDKVKASLCERFKDVHLPSHVPSEAPAAPAPEVPVALVEAVVREWRSLATCLGMIEYSEKGLRAIMEALGSYKHALGDPQVYAEFKTLAEHGRKGNRPPELKEAVAAWEAALNEAHGELREELEALLRRGEEQGGAAQGTEEARDEQGPEEGTSEDGENEEEDEEAQVAADGTAAHVKAEVEEPAQTGPAGLAAEGQGPGEASGGEGEAPEEEAFKSCSESEQEGDGGDEEEEQEGYSSGDETDAAMDCDDAPGPGIANQEAATPPPIRQHRAAQGATPLGAAGAGAPHGSPMALTPMAVTPPPGAAQSPHPPGNEDAMAWSPAPAIAPAVATAAAAGLGGGGHGAYIKPDPYAAAPAAMGPMGPVPYIKSDPDGRAHAHAPSHVQPLQPQAQAAAWPGFPGAGAGTAPSGAGNVGTAGHGVRGVVVKPDPEGFAFGQGPGQAHWGAR